MSTETEGASSMEQEQKTFSKETMEKFAFLGQLARPGVRRLAGAAGIGLGGGAAGYSLGKNRWQPARLPVADPQSGEFMGEVIGPNQYMREIADAAEEYQETGDPTGLDEVLRDADEYGVVWKGASADIDDAEQEGRKTAHVFFNCLRKSASLCAKQLREVGVIDDENVKQASVSYGGDIEKMAELFVMAGIANGQARTALDEKDYQEKVAAGGVAGAAQALLGAPTAALARGYGRLGQRLAGKGSKIGTAEWNELLAAGIPAAALAGLVS